MIHTFMSERISSDILGSVLVLVPGLYVNIKSLFL